MVVGFAMVVIPLISKNKSSGRAPYNAHGSCQGLWKDLLRVIAPLPLPLKGSRYGCKVLLRVISFRQLYFPALISGVLAGTKTAISDVSVSLLAIHSGF